MVIHLPPVDEYPPSFYPLRSFLPVVVLADCVHQSESGQMRYYRGIGEMTDRVWAGGRIPLNAMAIGDGRNSGVPHGSFPLVGRAAEQRLLRDRLAASLDGHGSLVIIGGEAGIGKTSLARDLAAAAASHDFLVLVGHCYDLTATPPYGPWLDLAAGFRPEAGLPAFPAVFATGRIEEIDSRSALFAEMRAFFAGLCAVRPTLLVLEDVHWSDPASIELLRHLGTNLTSQALLLVVTYRVDELTRHRPFYQQLPALIRETQGLRVDLRRLTTADLRDLVAVRYTLPAISTDRLVGYLERHAEGNPFFAVELLRALEDTGLLQLASTGWELGELDQVVMPSLVRQVIDGRVARLGEQTRRLLSLAAVIGQDVPLDLWARVGDIGEETLLAIVEESVEAHLLDARPDGRHVRFVHALTREALYEGIVPPRRRIWHQDMGDALATAEPVNPDAVAYHLQQAGDPRAWEWYVRAGERAQRAYAWLTAMDRFATAAELLDGRYGFEGQRGRLLYRCGRLQRYSNTARGIANLTVAEHLAHTVGDRVLAADATYSRGLLHCFADKFGVGLVDMEAGIVELEQLTADQALPSWSKATWMADALPPRELANMPEVDPAADALIGAGIHHRRGGLPWFLAAAGHLERAHAMAEQFVALADEIRAGVLVISATGHSYLGLGLVHAALGRPNEAERAFARAREIYDVIDHHAVIGFSLLSELQDVVLPYHADRVNVRRRVAAAAEAALNRAGGAFPSDRYALRARLSLHYLEGHWDEAIAIVEATPEPGNYVLQRAVIAAMAPIWYYQGDEERLRALIREHLPQGPATAPGGVVYVDGLLLQRFAAHQAIDRGDLATAAAWLDANDRWLAWNGSVLGQAENRIAWAGYFRATGDLPHALGCAEAAVQLATEPRQPLARLTALRVRGQLNLETGAMDTAADDLTTSLALADACAVPFERALTLLAVAELHRTTNNLTQAEADLADIRAICTPLRAHRILMGMTDPAGKSPASLGGPPPVAGLTPREIEVLRLVSQGMTDSEVATILFISPRTVSQHLRSIYGKLNVSTRAAATRFAVEQGLS
jgi:DNA-binding CsgD family transcriptional regulator/tetratricopeptide (TPR) repeat protein